MPKRRTVCRLENIIRSAGKLKATLWKYNFFFSECVLKIVQSFLFFFSRKVKIYIHRFLEENWRRRINTIHSKRLRESVNQFVTRASCRNMVNGFLYILYRLLIRESSRWFMNESLLCKLNDVWAIISEL